MTGASIAGAQVDDCLDDFGATNFVLSVDQEAIQQSIRGLLESACPESLVRELREPGSSGHSSALWSRLARDGWLSIALPADMGGADASLFELGLVYEELGRALVPTTYYSTMHAAHLIKELGTHEQAGDYLGRIGQGDLIGTVAWLERQARHDIGWASTSATRTSDGWSLSGSKAFVQNGRIADFLIVPARIGQDGNLVAFVVPRESPGIRMRDHQTVGGDRQTEIEFDAVRLADEALLGRDANRHVRESLDHTLDRMTALQCMEMAGGAQMVLDMTVKHVSERSQFGRPIGTFQAVQHHLANASILVEGSRTSALDALARLDAGGLACKEVSIAKVWGSSAYVNVTLTAHQLHGGMGYTREAPLLMWSQRAKAAQVSLGGAGHHLDRIARSIGL